MMRRVLRAQARDAARFASVLRVLDPMWRSEAFALAGGHAALWGAGQYVNRAFAVGLDAPMTGGDFDMLEERSAAVGVEPALVVTEATVPAVQFEAESRGYVARSRVTALRRRLDDIDPLVSASVHDTFVIQAASDQLRVWQQTAAIGWEHQPPAARRASDAFAAAAAEIDGSGFVIARETDTGQPVGCATLNVRDGIATLRGMSTVPDHRRRGVQGLMIRHRLAIARAAGCEIAITTAVPGEASERNLLRNGFEPWFSETTFAQTQRRPAG